MTFQSELAIILQNIRNIVNIFKDLCRFFVVKTLSSKITDIANKHHHCYS